MESLPRVIIFLERSNSPPSAIREKGPGHAAFQGIQGDPGQGSAHAGSLFAGATIKRTGEAVQIAAVGQFETGR